MSESKTFKIVTHKTNSSGSLPAHYDICLTGNEDSLITVWDSLEMAQEIVQCLEKYPNKKT